MTDLQILPDELLYEGRRRGGSERVGSDIEDGLLAVLGAVHVLLQADEVITALGRGETQQLPYLLPAGMACGVSLVPTHLGKQS